jgi:hypothetical protein
MELDPAALQLDPGMAGAAVEVERVRAQAARLEDRREPVKTNCRVKYPVLFNFK